MKNNENERENKNKIKKYALIKVGENNLLKLYDSFNASEKEFREYLENNKKEFKKGNIEYYAIREDDKYIAQVTVMYNNSNIESSTIKDKRIYFNHLSLVKNRTNIGFEKLLIDLIITKLQEKKKNKTSIFEYTIRVGVKQRNFKKIIESLGFKEYKEYIDKKTFKKELLYLRKDKEK